MKQIADLYQSLNSDPAREKLGFSSEMEAANLELITSRNQQEAATSLGKWLHRFQPCLFGRVSAKLDRIHYCILNEADLLSQDEFIKRKVQQARQEWTRAAFEGRKSAFVILAVSEKLALAAPDIQLNQFAQRLCSLYLLEENISNDLVYTDEVFLEKPDSQRTTWRWLAGVNFFAAAADRRWWQDHRIPGGVGFSVNSVGHLVKSGALMQELNEVASDAAPLVSTKVDSLAKALEFAMRTIWNAADAASGKATQLLPLGDQALLPVRECPADLPGFLKEKNYCTYLGYYHTDVTLPSDYFLPDVRRSPRIHAQELDFTYLFRDHVDNPAYSTMGEGRRIRGDGPIGSPSLPGKTTKSEPIEVQISESLRLRDALGG
ncbi:hypothetical protein [Bradyrhizobium sp. Ec3.3]|uniref:hypothetical protein n=1 Tax=Bradyrhizobium sp. Ec3.3 TaxID=189753 RepID=UPI00042900F3|nr:hypothetical protein [Bradyrhizobium sp. Ec3.3]